MRVLTSASIFSSLADKTLVSYSIWAIYLFNLCCWACLFISECSVLLIFGLGGAFFFFFPNNQLIVLLFITFKLYLLFL